MRQVVEGDTSVTDGGPLRFSKVMLVDTAERVLNAAVEQNRDADGIVLPAAIAPFTVVVTPVHPERLAAAREIYQKLAAEGVDVLLDDRDARPGVKFKDADLIGIPYRINVGKKLAGRDGGDGRAAFPQVHRCSRGRDQYSTLTRNNPRAGTEGPGGSRKRDRNVSRYRRA